MKALLVIPVCWAVSAPVGAAAAPDVRNAAWGMTKAQVIAAEPARPSDIRQNKDEVVVEYDSVRYLGCTGRLLYIFGNDKLVRVKFFPAAEHDDLNGFIADFRALDPQLREQYGKPVSDRAIWTDDSTQLEPKSYLDQDRATPASILPSDPQVGLAVSLGHLKLYTEWETRRTKIVHAMTGADGEVAHEIEFHTVNP